jgi:hypothetical protein
MRSIPPSGEVSSTTTGFTGAASGQKTPDVLANVLLAGSRISLSADSPSSVIFASNSPLFMLFWGSAAEDLEEEAARALDARVWATI